MHVSSIQNSKFCPPVISITTTAAVNGDWVAAARNAAMQSKTATLDASPSCAKEAMCSPIIAPMVNDGVKMPPGMPAQ